MATEGFASGFERVIEIDLRHTPAPTVPDIVPQGHHPPPRPSLRQGGGRLPRLPQRGRENSALTRKGREFSRRAEGDNSRRWKSTSPCRMGTPESRSRSSWRSP